MTDRFPVPHVEHDLLLVAALTAGDLQPPDRAAAEQLVLSCPDCTLLADDLRAIAVATAALPARARPRDFSIRPEDAARLGPRGWRGLVAALAGQRAAGLKPLATGLTTLGIAGLLLAAMPSIQLGGAASAPGPTLAPAAGAPSHEVDAMGGPAASGPAASAAPREGSQYHAFSQPPAEPVPVTGQAASPMASSMPLDNSAADESPAVPDRFGPAQPAQPAVTPPDTRPPSPLVVLSAALVFLGLGLFGIRWTARRLTEG